MMPENKKPAVSAAETSLRVSQLTKTFHLHTQGGTVLPVLSGLDLDLYPGECVALFGPSGAGKSSLMRTIYGNYKASSGSISIRHDGRLVDIANAEPRVVMDVRRRTLGYVSQFLRVIPRVSTLDIVMEPLLVNGVDFEEAAERAKTMLTRLRIPERLWSIAPATFSGGEQQRVNLAHGFISDYPIMMLDEPTASLDAENRDTVIQLICEARDRGAALLGIFHDEAVRDRVADRVFVMPLLEAAA